MLFAHLLLLMLPCPQNVARWEKDRLRMAILEEANIGGVGWGGRAGVYRSPDCRAGWGDG